MCALIAIAVFSTEENQKDSCLERTLESIRNTVDFSKHRLMLSINAFTERTLKITDKYANIIQYIVSNPENIGTAKAINELWALRIQGENLIKMDDDIETSYIGWVDEMDAAIAREPKIGQVGLKRKDCWEWPGHKEEDFRSELIMLPHQPGESWITVEKVKHVIGSCVMHSAALIDKVGFLYQPGVYGYDDVIMSHRTHLAGMYSCFLSHIQIDHIDDGKTPYQDWKQKHSGQYTQEVIKLVHEMYAGIKPIYYGL